MLSEDDLRERVRNIDKDALDKEVMDSPSLVLAVHDMLTKAVDKRDLLKHELKVLEAQLTFRFMSKYERMEKKVTDRVVRMSIVRDDSYIETERDLLRQEKIVNRLQGLRESMRNRSDMIGRLTYLYSEGYWTGDSVTGSRRSSEAVHEARRRRMAVKRKNRRERRSPSRG